MKKSELKQLIREELDKLGEGKNDNPMCKSKYLKEGKVGEYTVVWTDRDYKEHKKVFKNDPDGPPENGLEKAKEFKKKLEDKDKKDKYGLYRSITLKEANYTRKGGNGPHDEWEVILNNGNKKILQCENKNKLKYLLGINELIIGIKSAKKINDKIIKPVLKENKNNILDTEVQGSWDPTGWDNEYLIDQKDLKDESVIKSFIELNGLDPLILDIWRYGKSNLGTYPSKITPKGMVYSSNKVKGSIEIEFTKPIFTIHRTTASIGKSRGQIDYHFAGRGKFSFKNFKDFMEVGKIQ